MLPQNNFAVSYMPLATCATNATQTMSFDTKGYEYLNCYVLLNTHATNGTTIQTLKFSEHDSTTTVASMTDIVALTGGTATSASVGYVLPTVAVAGTGGTIEFQIDLRARKRYLGLSITHGATTMYTGALALLSRAKDAPSGTTNRSESNLVSTAVQGVLQVVTA